MTPRVGDIWCHADTGSYYLLTKQMSWDGDFEVLRLDKAGEGLYCVDPRRWRFVA
jgi:hypothetical protein